MEANLDDQAGEGLGYVMTQLLAAGAYDVYFTSIQMKKNRPAIKLSVLSAPSDRLALTKLILAETSTIGVRYQTWHRTIMRRHFVTATTPYGPVKIKVATYDGIIKKTPEYADCASLARIQQVPLMMVYQAALAALEQLDEEG